MSLFFVSRAPSAFTRSSTALRCCRVACAFSWSCQKFGSLVLASNSASCLRADSASKKAPHELDTFIQLGEALLQVFDVFGHENLFYRISNDLGGLLYERHSEQYDSYDHAEPAEPVAESGVGSQVAAEIVGGG